MEAYMEIEKFYLIFLFLIKLNLLNILTGVLKIQNGKDFAEIVLNITKQDHSTMENITFPLEQWIILATQEKKILPFLLTLKNQEYQEQIQKKMSILMGIIFLLSILKKT